MNSVPLMRPKWPVPKNIRAYCTLRHPGNSWGMYSSFNLALHVQDNPQDVLANRKALMHYAQLPSEPRWLNQTHSTIPVIAERSSIETPADASYTQQKGIVCVVMTADCLPILVTNQEGTEVAAIHAGWRGLADGVIEQTISALHSHADSLMIWIGPSISQPYYEVGEDFYAAFKQQHTQEELDAAFEYKHSRSNVGANNIRPNSIDAKKGECYSPLQNSVVLDNNTKWLANVPLLAQQRLIKLGVKAQNIYLSNECTYARRERYFSYRRDNVTGRMASFIWIVGSE